MMAFHFIAVFNDYVDGRRIGWHYSSEDKLDIEVLSKFASQIRDKCGDVQLGIHKLSTTSTLWKSVTEKDSFFDDVFITNEIEDFIKHINAGKERSAYDVAKFILTLQQVSHLKLQKLLYYAYAEFLLRTQKKLFNEQIVAFAYGPVVEEVFHKFRKHGSTPIDFKEDESFYLQAAQSTFTPSFVRMLSTEDGITAIECIIEVVNKYKKFTALQLVDKTHIEGGPWQRVYRDGANSAISDEMIVNFHELVI